VEELAGQSITTPFFTELIDGHGVGIFVCRLSMVRQCKSLNAQHRAIKLMLAVRLCFVG
jgi:hypothetical protein